MMYSLLIVTGLGWWALRLMEQAHRRQEFSRMLAALLVVFAAGGVLAIHFLMSDVMRFLSEAQP